MVSHSLVLGYHGCDHSLVEEILNGKLDLKPSQNKWDWLGHGIYFWEGSSTRALRWAADQSRRAGSTIASPAVLGAIIDLGNCLDLTDAAALALVKGAHGAYVDLCNASGANPLVNRGTELSARFLDCAVLETLHLLRQHEHQKPFDTVRGFFVEGRELYPGAGFRELDHVQICARSPTQIVGYFLPRG